MEPVPTPLEATTAHVTLVTQEMEAPVWTLMSALLAPTTVVSMQSIVSYDMSIHVLPWPTCSISTASGRVFKGEIRWTLLHSLQGAWFNT